MVKGSAEQKNIDLVCQEILFTYGYLILLKLLTIMILSKGFAILWNAQLFYG